MSTNKEDFGKNLASKNLAGKNLVGKNLAYAALDDTGNAGRVKKYISVYLFNFD